MNLSERVECEKCRTTRNKATETCTNYDSSTQPTPTLYGYFSNRFSKGNMLTFYGRIETTKPFFHQAASIKELNILWDINLKYCVTFNIYHLIQ